MFSTAMRSRSVNVRLDATDVRPQRIDDFSGFDVHDESGIDPSIVERG